MNDQSNKSSARSRSTDTTIATSSPRTLGSTHSSQVGHATTAAAEGGRRRGGTDEQARSASHESPGATTVTAATVSTAAGAAAAGAAAAAAAVFTSAMASLSPTTASAPSTATTATATNSSSSTLDYDTLPPQASTTTHLLAGSLAGILEHTVLYPLDSIKTRLQQVSPKTPAGSYLGLSHAATAMASTEGWRGFWRGVSSVVLGAGPAHAVHFAVYEEVKRTLAVWGGADGEAGKAGRGGFVHGSHALAGACATVANDALMNPFDVIKQRMQTYGSTYSNVFSCFLAILRREGPSAFYVSYLTTISMTIPFQSLHFATYEYLRHTLNPDDQYHPPTHVIAGALAGALAAFATTPLDVVKTLLQTRGEACDADVRRVRGFWDACRVVYGRYGWRGFGRGAVPRVVSHMPATAVSWVAYEYFKWRLLR